MLQSRVAGALAGFFLFVATPSHAERVLVAPAASLGLPLGPAISLATATCLASGGLTGRFEPAVIVDGALGVGGWRLSVGYRKAANGPSWPLADAFLYGVRMTALKTWARPFNARAKETYVGPAFVVRAANLTDDRGWGFDLGALYRIDGPKNHGRLMPYVAIDVGQFLAF